MSIEIEHLDDETALRVLRALARARPKGDVPDVAQLAQILPPLTTGVEPSSGVRDADLARAALVWWAQDAPQARTIESIIAEPAPKPYAFDPGLGALVCVLLLLKTKAVIERDKDGRWHFKAELIELKQGPLGAVLNLFANLTKKG
ncbi:MAG: hypothetical protein WCO56_28425 [Verrucomicrobiota bacterium]